MQSLTTSIELFSGEKYRDLPYGTVYYVAGTATPTLNQYVHAHANYIAQLINRDESNWVTCTIIYLDADNPLFQPRSYSAFYSALLPASETPKDSYNFFVKSLEGLLPESIESVIATYFATLQRQFDNVLDNDTYTLTHPQEENIDSGIRFSIGGKTPIEDFDPSVWKTSVEDKGRATDSFKLFREKEQLPVYTSPSRLVITEYQYRFMLPDYNREIKFGAQIKALYVLFLLHQEGIRMQEISDYKQEFTMLYRLFTNRSDMDALMLKIDSLLDVLNPNALNVKKSQCKKALQEAIPEANLRQYYEIEVHRGEAHTISLDRSLVTYPATLLSRINK